jgi:hypothetical protein
MSFGAVAEGMLTVVDSSSARTAFPLSLLAATE